MKFAFLVPDGVGVRNYLYSNLVDQLLELSHEIFIWHRLGNVVIKEIRMRVDERVRFGGLVVHREGLLERVMREATAYARLSWNSRRTNNPTIVYFGRKDSYNWKQRIIAHVAEGVGMWAAMDYDRIVQLDQIRNRRIVKRLSPYLNFLRSERPDILFCTHQRSPEAAPAMAAARKLGIPAVTAIFSWDNIPKGRMAVTADYYFVWSEYMRRELLQSYPEIGDNQVIVTGTPQFEFYCNQDLLQSRETFCQKYGLNPEKPIVCYSGDDIRTSPHDPDYLRDVAEALARIDESIRPQLLFRRAPVDPIDRFDRVISEFKVIIFVSNPLWRWESDPGSFSTCFPTFDDVRLLVNVCYHCDLVINVGSTMAHDFTQFDKPTLYIRYDQPYKKQWTVERIYRYEHFRTMEGLDAVGWIRHREEIGERILGCLEHPHQYGPDRKKWFKVIHTPSPDESSRKIAETLISLAGK